MADAPALTSPKKQTLRSSGKGNAPAVPPLSESSTRTLLPEVDTAPRSPEEFFSDKEDEDPDLRTLIMELVKVQKEQATQIRQLTQMASDQPVRSVEPSIGPSRRRTTTFVNLDPESEEERPRRDRNPRLQTLSDGITQGPSLDAWLLQVKGEIRNHPQHYPLLDDQLLLMVRFTEDPAQRHLMARMKVNTRRPFRDLDDAITTLSRALGKQNEDALADQAYHKLTMEPSQPFASFVTEFLLCADQANISEDVRERDLWFKVTSKLRIALGPTRFQYSDFNSLSEALFHTDLNIRFEEEQLREQRRVKYTPKNVGTTSPLKPHRTPNGRVQPLLERGATPVIADRSRSKTPGVDSDNSTVLCYNCGNRGHFAKTCPEPKKLTAELKEIYGSDWEEPESEDDPISENE